MKTYYAAVVVESEVTIRINPNADAAELIKEFSECISDVETIEEIVEFAASHIARGEPTFIEGIGSVEYDYGQPWQNYVIMQYTIWTDVSTKIVN
jgi:hypothetical protein